MAATRSSAGHSPATRRCRGTHSTKVKNLTPSYTVPDSHFRRGRLKFISELVEASQGRDVTRCDEAALVRTWNGRKKQFYRDRRRAIQALHTVFSEHVNLVTHQVEISLRLASDAAGLTTISDAEKKKAELDPNYTPRVSISRASRAFRDMVELGWFRADAEWQVWDKEAGQWIDKFFEATPFFFQAAGITQERLDKVQNQRLGYLRNKALKAGRTPEEVGRMSITQLKEESRQEWRRRAFERRALECARKRTHRALYGKTRHEQRVYAQQRVLDSLGDEARFILPHQFKDLVNKEIAMLRKFAGVQPLPG